MKQFLDCSENLEFGIRNSCKGPLSNYVYKKRGVGGQNNRLFVNVYTIENVNGGGQKKPNLVSVVCERPLIHSSSFLAFVKDPGSLIVRVAFLILRSGQMSEKNYIHFVRASLL